MAVRPGGAKWTEIRQWMRGTKPYTPDLRAGQAHVDSDGERLRSTIRKGLSRIAEYTPEEMRERTLDETDGR